MATWYVNALTGDDADSGATRALAKLTFASALTAAKASASGSEIIELEGGTGQVYPQTAFHLANLAGLEVQSRDTAGVLSTDTANFDRADMPVFQAAHVSSLFAFVSGDLTITGIDFDGAGLSTDACFFNADLPFSIRDCVVRDFTTYGHSMRNGSSAKRTIYSGNGTHGVDITSGGATLVYCAFVGNGTEAVGRAAGAQADEFFNCAFAGNGSGVETYVIENAGGSEDVKNCLFVDNLTLYGAEASTHGTKGNSWSSDPGTYHTTANWDGATGATQYEQDPIWLTAPALAPESWAIQNAVLAFGGAWSREIYTLDGSSLGAFGGDDPTAGPMLIATVPDLAVIPRGTHSVLLKLAAGYFLAAHAEPDAWTLTGVTRPPWVATVTLGGPVTLGSVTGYTEAFLTTDRQCHEAATYTLVPADALYASPAWPSATFSGLRPSLTGGAASSPAPLLLDLHAPWVRGDGAPGGYWERGADGDYVMSGGLHTVRKVVWAWLLTKLGESVYSPGFGTELRHKRVRPADLDAESKRLADGLAKRIPWVDSASVTLEFRRDNHMRVGVRVRAFGEVLNDTQAVKL